MAGRGPSRFRDWFGTPAGSGEEVWPACVPGHEPVASPPVPQRLDHVSPPRLGRAGRALLPVLAAAGVAVMPCLGQQPEPAVAGAAVQRVDPLEITGRTFSGLRLPTPVTEGPIEFSGSRAWAWTETD